MILQLFNYKLLIKLITKSGFIKYEIYNVVDSI